MPKAAKKTTKTTTKTTTKRTTRADPLARTTGNASKKPPSDTSSEKASSSKLELPPLLAEDPKVPSLSEEACNASDPDGEPNYLFLVHLSGTFSPLIQRVLSVPGSFTFAKFHHVLQAAFGWASCHAYAFDLKLSANRDKAYFMGGPSVLVLSQNTIMASVMPNPERYRLDKDYTLADVLEHPEYKDKTYLSYEYDHGDSWEHEITVLGKAAPTLRNDLGGITQKAFCLAGEGHPCAEDVGSYPVSSWRPCPYPDPCRTVVEWKLVTSHGQVEPVSATSLDHSSLPTLCLQSLNQLANLGRDRAGRI